MVRMGWSLRDRRVVIPNLRRTDVSSCHTPWKEDERCAVHNRSFFFSRMGEWVARINLELLLGPLKGEALQAPCCICWVPALLWWTMFSRFICVVQIATISFWLRDWVWFHGCVSMVLLPYLSCFPHWSRSHWWLHYELQHCRDKLFMSFK